jgi:probable F420-dependent oxidoreductase
MQPAEKEMAEATHSLGLHMTLAATSFDSSIPKLAGEAEKLGYSTLWMGEVDGHDTFVMLAALAHATSTAGLATGIAPIQLRPPSAMARSFLTLNEISGGRAVAGIGVSSPAIVERWHGLSYRMPLVALRECVQIMRELFSEGRCKFQGKVYKCDFKLGFRRTQAQVPRIYIAALNPPMLRLAGEIADGVVLNYTPPEAVPSLVAEIRAGAERAGRRLADIDIAIYLRMCITDEEGDVMRAFKRELATYAFADTYVTMFTRYGLADELAEVRRLWKEGKREQAPEAISEASARKLTLFGPTEAGRDFVARCRAAGITQPVIFPLGPQSTAARDFSNTMRALAGA